jgi:anaerobic selenocysteine-containing dehydrogenase
MGINQGYEATRTAQAIINLALMTGNIGRPDTGANSITGQCNAMGSRLYSNTSGLLGGRDFTNPDHRTDVAQILDIEETKIPTVNCLAYDLIMDGIADGKIKALWVIATNTAHSWINSKRYNTALKDLDFLVVQDMYHTTETAQLADLILPAAGWGEKDGTFINSERRIGLVKKVSRAPGQALSDFNILKLVSNYWSPETAKTFANWSDPEATFHLLTKLSKNRPCDISGIKSYQQIDDQNGIQWPYPEGTAHNTRDQSQRRLLEDAQYYHPDKKAKFIFAAPAENPELPDAEYPFILLTGRGTSAQCHTQTRTAKSEVLKKLYPEEIYAELNPEDAEQLAIEPNQKITLTSRRASIEARAFPTPTIKKGQIFLPMHYKKTNPLTHPSFDPHSRQPNYKSCSIAISKNCL